MRPIRTFVLALALLPITCIAVIFTGAAVTAGPTSRIVSQFNYTNNANVPVTYTFRGSLSASGAYNPMNNLSTNFTSAPVIGDPSGTSTYGHDSDGNPTITLNPGDRAQGSVTTQGTPYSADPGTVVTGQSTVSANNQGGFADTAMTAAEI